LRPVCFVSRLAWPFHFGGAELVTHRLAERLGSRASVIARRRPGSAAVAAPYHARHFGSAWARLVPEPWREKVWRREVMATAPRQASVWHAVDAWDVGWAHDLKSRYGGAVVATLHWLPPLNRRPEDWPAAVSRSAQARQARARASRDGLASCDAVVAVSDHMRRLVEDVVSRDRLHVIHNGLDRPPEVPPRPAGPLTFLCLGRLAPGKGVDVLLEAWRRVAPRLGGARLLVAGTGDTRTVERAGADPALRVSYLGYVEGEARERAFAAASVLVFPPDEPEAWGLAPLEAMARGRPVLGTAIGGSADFMKHGENGWVVAPADAEALARGLEEVARVEAGTWSRLSTGALRTAEPYSWDRCLARYEALWATLPWSPPA
jgi:glycosyltransferase involved in cell wall biosynthesis